MSGIAVSDECITTFNELKSKKAHKFIIFKIENNAVVKVAECGAPSQTFEDFKARLVKDEPCYAVFDFDYEAEGATRSKLVFIAWIPDVAKVKAKMIYASTKEALKMKIEGALVDVQACDASEISHEVVLAKVKGGK